jgi:hypothetical protein
MLGWNAEYASREMSRDVGGTGQLPHFSRATGQEWVSQYASTAGIRLRGEARQV